MKNSKNKKINFLATGSFSNPKFNLEVQIS